MKKKILIFSFIFIVLIGVRAGASTEGTIDSDTQNKISNLYNYITNLKLEEELFNDMTPKEFVEYIVKNGEAPYIMKDYVSIITKYFFKELSATMKIMISIIIVGLLCGLLKNLQGAFSSEKLCDIAYFACYGVLIVLLSKGFLMAIGIAKDAIGNITNLMAALIPVLFSLIIGVGGVSQVATLDPLVLVVVNIVPRIYVTFIIPLILMGFVLSFVNNISKDYKISKLTKLCKQAVLWAQGIIMTIFIGIVTVRGITSSTLDAVTAKTAKFAVDNFIPVVGKALSDAVATVAGYSLILKNAISTLGLILIIFIILVPIIKLFLTSIIYKLTASLLEPVSENRITDCITSAGDSLILIMSCLICISVMFFIMISIMASAGQFLLGT